MNFFILLEEKQNCLTENMILMYTSQTFFQKVCDAGHKLSHLAPTLTRVKS